MLHSTETPPIIIEDGIQISTQQVTNLYVKAQEVCIKFFGKPLLPNSVNKIHLSSDSLNSDPDTVGQFTYYRDIFLYPHQMLRPGRYVKWQEVLAHELGHAYHAQCCPKAFVGDILEVCREAIAEMMVPVIHTRGNTDHIIRQLSKQIHGRLLFGPMTTLLQYPSLEETEQDSAQLFYVINRYGFDAAIKLIAKPSLDPGEKAETTDENLSISDFYRNKAQLVERDFMNEFGVTRSQLYDDAQNWYMRYSTN